MEDFLTPNIPAWTYKGESFSSFVGGLSSHNTNLTELQDLEEATKNGLIPRHKNTEDDPFIIADLFAGRNKLDNLAAKIPVEKITSPILLLSGEDDAIWTSNQYCQNIINRLKNSNFDMPYQHMNYSNAGHGIIASYNGSIYHPVGKFWCRLGGTLNGNEDASKNSLLSILHFIETYIKGNIQ